MKSFLVVIVISRIFTSTVAVADPTYSSTMTVETASCPPGAWKKSLYGQGSDKWRNCQAEDKTVLLHGIASVPFQHGNLKCKDTDKIAQRNDAEFYLSNLAMQADAGLKTPWAVLRTTCAHLVRFSF